MITDNFAGNKEIDKLLQGEEYTEEGKGIIKYYLEGHPDKTLEVVYDRTRSKDKQFKSQQSGEVSVKGLSHIKTLKPLIYPHSKKADDSSSDFTSKRYVEMINRVRQKLGDLKAKKTISNKNKNVNSSEYDDVLKDPSVLIDLMDPNFDIIRPNIDYFMEQKLCDRLERKKITKLTKGLESTRSK